MGLRAFRRASRRESFSKSTADWCCAASGAATTTAGSGAGAGATGCATTGGGGTKVLIGCLGPAGLMPAGRGTSGAALSGRSLVVAGASSRPAAGDGRGNEAEKQREKRSGAVTDKRPGQAAALVCQPTDAFLHFEHAPLPGRNALPAGLLRQLMQLLRLFGFLQCQMTGEMRRQQRKGQERGKKRPICERHESRKQT